MVQQEVKKKTRIYGTVAALSAIVLVALIFVFGSTPGFTPNPPTTNPPTTETAAVSAMKTFSSYDELRNYLAVNTQGSTSTYGGGPLDSKFFGQAMPDRAAPPSEPAPSLSVPETASQGGYSTTNIQVAGVDEADTVKTDGKYIYVASNDYSTGQNHVYVVKADPQDPRVIAKITLENNTYLAGIYLSQDSNKLVVIGSEYQVYAYDVAVPAAREAMIYPYRSEVQTFISVYDISDKVHPVLASNFTLSGSYFNSRMIGDYVYAVVSQQAYVLESGVIPLPKVYAETGISDVAPSRIYYSDTAYYADVVNNYFTYTTFVGLNLRDDGQKLTNMTVLMGGASTMYVSLNNIYVTYPTWKSEQGEYTSIYRIRVNRNILTFEAKGSVSGYVLNQYSMDEHNNFFRLATTSQMQSTQNNVYVLDMNLTTVGKIENLALGERIYSARFMGDKGYLVTFRQVDPFFVLDLSNPANPKVAGQLKIPGYSSYLHPYDENYVIGLGKENNTVKLSLFDVTNVYAPTEIAKYIVQGDYTDSQALYDPKAFLFDKQKELLVIPISINQYGVITPGPIDPSGKPGMPTMQGGFWQGAFVFKLTLSGFELRGGVTHQENTTSQYYWYGDYNQMVNRALYIGNTLYTISNAKVKLNSLTDLTQIAEIKLS
jgi:uncharacterized secreted protein with C-terminal beta-propeller domain